PSTDVIRTAQQVCFVPTADIRSERGLPTEAAALLSYLALAQIACVEVTYEDGNCNHHHQPDQSHQAHHQHIFAPCVKLERQHLTSGLPAFPAAARWPQVVGNSSKA